MKVIGYNTQQQNIDKSKNVVAEQSYLGAKALIAEFMTIPESEDIEFRANFYTYVGNHIGKDKLLRHLDINKLLNMKALYSLTQKYKEYYAGYSNNYDIVATTPKQIEAYDYAVKLCKLLNSQPLNKHLGYFLNLPLVKSGDTFEPDLIAISAL